MDFEAVVKLLFSEFDKQRIRFAVIGGFALQAAGLSRMTHDIDFLIHIEDAPKAKAILTSIGYDISHESKDAINFWGKLKSLGGVDFIIAHRKYALAMLQRAQGKEIIAGYHAKVVVVEDLIGLKLQAAVNDPARASQDMADIEWIIRHHRKDLDLTLLREYFGLFEKLPELEKILKEAGHAQ